MRRNAHHTYSYKYASTEGKRKRLLFFVIIKKNYFLVTHEARLSCSNYN